MKKLKLLSCLSMVTVATSTAVVLTSCSSNSEDPYSESVLHKRFDMFNKKADPDQTYTNMLIGDSFLDMMRDEENTGIDFDTTYPNSFNYSVGGSTFAYWEKWVSEIVVKNSPEKIWINLGINDLFFRTDPLTINENAILLFTKLRIKYPTSKIYVFNIVKAPLKTEKWTEIEDFNQWLSQNKEVLNIDEICDVCSRMNEADCFKDDKLHPSIKGYSYYFDFMNKY